MADDSGADSIVCFICLRPVPGYLDGLNHHIGWHIQKKDFLPDTSFYDCTFPACNMRYTHWSSLKRHIREKHPSDVTNVPNENHIQEHFETVLIEGDQQDQLPQEDEDTSAYAELKRTASLSICRLTSDVGLPQSKISEAVNIFDNLISQLSEFYERKVVSFLKTHDVDPAAEPTRLFLETFKNVNLFEYVKTFSKQKAFLKSLATDMPEPQEKCVGVRDTVRHVSGVPKQTMVNETFQYVPIVETLKLIFRNPSNRELLQREHQIDHTPGLREYRSFRDGQTYQNKEYFQQHPNAIRLSLYQDDVELGNALSSRAGKNKMCNYSFKIQNFPEKFNSAPRSIFPIIFALSKTVKKIGYNHLMEPLISDLKRLEKGVTVYYGTERFEIRAVVTMFCGDSLAAHDVFGLLSPSARFFCRICTIPRPVFHEEPLRKFPARTLEWYKENLEAVQCGNSNPSQCGLKAGGCILNELENYHITENWSLDAMHDLAEGVIPLTVLLVLSRYSKQLGFTKAFINQRIRTFSYGFVDRKNRPMSNISTEMLSHPASHRLRQTAVQNILLLRAFPFLFGDKVPEDCNYMIMIGHLINITRILFSPVVSENMLAWLDEHLRLFDDFFYSNFKRRINKSHHMQHYSECIRRSGPMKQFNCLTFEQKNKIAKNQAVNCRNFRNICKSIAQRQCFKTTIEILENPFRDRLSYHSGSIINTESLDFNLPDDSMMAVYCPEIVTINGVEFRKNLLVALRNHEDLVYPSYGIIRNIIEVEGQTHFLLRACSTTCYNNFLQAYEVEVLESDVLVEIEAVFLHTTFSFRKTYNGDKKYISRRIFNMDY